jgi:hypothetical protein
VVVHEQFPAEAILLKEGRQVLGKAKVEALVKAMADFAEPTFCVIQQLSQTEARAPPRNLEWAQALFLGGHGMRAGQRS